MFSPKVLESRHSKFSGEIKVLSDFGYKYISTGQLTQSGGLVKDVWDPVLKKIGQNHKSWLILGLAGGTVAGMIAKKYHPSRLMGIEIDPVMIDLGKKYLKLGEIPNLEIIIRDAEKYILHLPLNLRFDYILVDMYLGDKLPSFVYSPKFLKRLKFLSSVVVFNHLFYDDLKVKNANKLVASLKQLFPNIQLMRKLTNLLIICSPLRRRHEPKVRN
jgi:spermidine synthase